MVDGPIAGNGDPGLVIGGPPVLQRFNFGKEVSSGPPCTSVAWNYAYPISQMLA